ncbi:uncharacterized [Tachysurus ichikawai]
MSFELSECHCCDPEEEMIHGTLEDWHRIKGGQIVALNIWTLVCFFCVSCYEATLLSAITLETDDNDGTKKCEGELFGPVLA